MTTVMENPNTMFNEFVRRWTERERQIQMIGFSDKYPEGTTPEQMSASFPVTPKPEGTNWYLTLSFDKDVPPFTRPYCARASTPIASYYDYPDIIGATSFIGQSIDLITRAVQDKKDPIFINEDKWVGEGKPYASIDDVPKYDPKYYGHVPERLIFRKGCEIAWSSANARRFYGMKADFVLIAYYMFGDYKENGVDAVCARLVKNIINHAVRCALQYERPEERAACYIIELAKAYSTLVTINNEEATGIPNTLCFKSRTPSYMIDTQEYSDCKSMLDDIPIVTVAKWCASFKGTSKILPEEERNAFGVKRCFSRMPRTYTGIPYNKDTIFYIPTDSTVSYLSTACAKFTADNLNRDTYTEVQQAADFTVPEYIAALTSSMSFMRYCHLSRDAHYFKANPKYPIEFEDGESAVEYVLATYKALCTSIQNTANFNIYFSLKVKAVGTKYDYCAAVFDSQGKLVAASKEEVYYSRNSAKSSAPKSSAPKASAPKSSAPKSSAPKSSAPKSSAPKSSAPKASAPKASAPKSSSVSTVRPPLTEKQLEALKGEFRRAKFTAMDILDNLENGQGNS